MCTLTCLRANGCEQPHTGIEATENLANSKNAKVVVIGNGKNGLPLILGGGGSGDGSSAASRESGDDVSHIVK